MGFFERFRKVPQQEASKSVEPRVLVPNFEVNDELEALVNEYINASTTMFGITHDYGIDMTTDINKPKIQENADLKDATERYFAAQERMKEIKRDHADELREYLKPYIVLQNPPESPYQINMDDWNRLRVAEAMNKK